MIQHRENRLHIAFFGRCNAGKSTLVNLLTGQNVAIVSEQSGTTTDTVKKTMELFKVGAVTLIDTAGVDDDSILGVQRKQKTNEAVSLSDIAIIVVSENKFGSYEEQLIQNFNSKNIPFLIVYNKQDAFPLNETTQKNIQKYCKDFICVSDKDTSSKERITELIRTRISAEKGDIQSVLNGIIKQNDIVLLVTPIDSSAPKGRLILPQVKMIRDILDNNAVSVVVKETQLEYALQSLKIKPKLVITDSQVFDYVNKIVPRDIYLTSFSVLLAKEKGAFDSYLHGVSQLDRLREGDKVLMLENCTHQPTCEDIGRVKLPEMIEKYTGKKLMFKALAGLNEQEDEPKDFSLVIQCGGCVATKKQLFNRLEPFISAGVPVTNYGMAIAYMNGIFKRACEIFFADK